MNDSKMHRILIVDDEVYNLDLLCRILNPLYTVKTAKNGASAIKMAEKHNPDLILLDVIMPDMSGFDVLTKLKKSDDTRDIPVIFITGLDSRQDEERGLLLGAVDYITKPFHDSIVKLRVKTHLTILEQMRTIEHLGMIDSLTDVPNRRGFDHLLSVEWGRSKREKALISLMMIDIDKFKHFNDHYGHAHGDVILKAVAQVISQTLRRSSDSVARWGGEEFTVLLPHTDLQGALDLAEKIRLNVEQMTVLTTDGTTTNVTISIGITTEIPNTKSQLDDFIKKSDKALYSAKEAGRNTVRSII